MKFLGFGAAALLVSATFGASSAQAAVAVTKVDLELALLVDVSGSVDSTEFNLQRQGYVNAFNSSAIQSIFASGKSAAVTFIYWSGGAEQKQAVGWTLINSASSSAAFAAAIAATTRPFSGNTAIGSALNFATPLFGTNLFDSARQVIDVSGDGATNTGANTAAARDAALAAGIDQINGLPILGDFGVEEFYKNNVQGGTNSFTLAANSFADFDAAVQLKIGREISNPGGVPEPATWAMMILGFGVVGGAMRRRTSGRTLARV